MIPKVRSAPVRCLPFLTALAAIVFALLPKLVEGQKPPSKLEITRAARPWEFLCAVGTHAGTHVNRLFIYIK